MSRIIVVVSGKGGVGKTTVTANLGVILGGMGYKVTLIDADVGLNNLDLALGLEDRVVYDVFDVIEGRAAPEEALVGSQNFPGVRLLPSVKGSHGIRQTAFQAVADSYALISDFVIIDAPAGVESGFHRAAAAAKEAIIVTTPQLSAVKDADRTRSALGVYDIDIKGLVVNRVRQSALERGEEIRGELIAEFMRVKLLGELPESDYILRNALSPPRSQAREAYIRLAETLLNGGEGYRVKTRRKLFAFRRRDK